MEPNIFVVYTKVVLPTANWYTSKVFLEQSQAEKYNELLVKVLDTIQANVLRVKSKVLILRVPATWVLTGEQELSLEDVAEHVRR